MLAHGGVLLVAPINAPYLLQNAIHLLTVPSTAMLTRYIDIAILYLHLSRSGIVSKRLNTLSAFGSHSSLSSSLRNYDRVRWVI